MKRGLAPKTVRNIHVMLHRALKDAVRWHDDVLRNVAEAANPPKGSGPEQEVWTPEQLRAFLAHVRGDRLYAMWLLVVTTGFRRGELAGLRRRDLATARAFPRRPRVVVDGNVVVSEPKTARSKRGLALDAATDVALRAHLKRQDAERARLELPAAGPDTLLFTWPDGREIHPDLITGWFQQHARRAGLPVIRLHDVRHSYATAAGAAGVHALVLSQRLGHASVAFTLQVYGHVLPGMDQDAADAVAALILGNEEAPPATAESASVDNSADTLASGPESGEEVKGSTPVQ